MASWDTQLVLRTKLREHLSWWKKPWPPKEILPTHNRKLSSVDQNPLIDACSWLASGLVFVSRSVSSHQKRQPLSYKHWHRWTSLEKPTWNDWHCVCVCVAKDQTQDFVYTVQAILLLSQNLSPRWLSFTQKGKAMFHWTAKVQPQNDLGGDGDDKMSTLVQC